ncbi:MAG: hypothetical protein JXR25_05385 [Pontiellaceae bacterium]|nr:hypothetical protein [Pontiellaceae bacterium]MBN2784238.1 hypothetical protein [Pontiellaceae bacterium]
MKRYLQSIFCILLGAVFSSSAAPDRANTHPSEVLTARFNIWLSKPADYESMVKRECGSFPEGNFYPFLVPALAFAHLAEMQDISAEDAARNMRVLIDMAIPQIIQSINPPQGDLLQLKTYRHQGTSLAMLNLVLSRYNSLCNDTRYKDLNNHISLLLIEALQERDGAAIDSYPAYTWYIDTIVAFASLKNRGTPDQQEEIDRLYEKHMEWRKNSIILPSGLPRAFAGSPSRGCDLSMQICLLAEIDQDRARNLYIDYVKHHWIDRGYAYGFSEWPQGRSHPAGGDIDSGPVLFGIGGTASGLGIGAARAIGDNERADRLTTELILTSGLIQTALQLAPENEYLKMLSQYAPLNSSCYSGFLYGDCSLFYAVTVPPLSPDQYCPEQAAKGH